MTEVRFTFDWYDDLLGRVQDAGLTFRPFGREVPPRTAVLRHDVDFSPRKAVRMAELEADRGVTATYFFLLSSQLYNPLNADTRETIAAIADLGHDVGLHFDSHQYWEGEPDHADLADQIDAERSVLAKVVDDPTDIVAFHNPPEWTLGREFSGFTHTYEPRYFEEVVYVADSNQRWRTEPPFADGVPDRIQILTHPVQWGDTDEPKNEHLRTEETYFRDRIHERVERGLTDNNY